ncbi:MAG: hypothetical protein R6X10_10445 [Desulfobacterales bacterium]
MYTAHPTFIQPENEDIKVWRYMDFTKFVSLIESQRLYFTRADRFKDPFEGSWPKVNVAMREIVPEGIPPDGHDAYLKATRDLGGHFKNSRRFMAINCWCMNEYESAAMWKLYLKSDEGIAIQSTYAKLKQSLIDDERIYLGKVKYIDYDKEYIGGGNVLNPFVHKRKSFEHEQEIRVIVSKWPTRIEKSLQIKVDIETLIERIYVAPSASDWFADLVEAVISRYGYNFEVVHSRLNEDPVF